MNLSNPKRRPPWWLASIAISCLLSLLIFWWSGIAPLSVNCRMLIAATAFPLCLMCTIHYDPDLWFRRMAVATLFTLLAGQVFAGISFRIPWAATAVEIEIPGIHWTSSVLLAGLTIFFTKLPIKHYFKKWASHFEQIARMRDRFDAPMRKTDRSKDTSVTSTSHRLKLPSR